MMWSAVASWILSIVMVGLTIRAARARQPWLKQHRKTVVRLGLAWQGLALVVAAGLMGAVAVTHRTLAPEFYAWVSGGVYAPLTIALRFMASMSAKTPAE